jgi:biofilm PGA synthesis lipoprotein PgaB
LRELGVTASDFVIGYSTDVFNPEAEPHMSWNEMWEMKKNGMGFYNHTYNLHYYAQTDMNGGKRPALSHPLYLASKDREETMHEYRKRIKSDLALNDKRLQEELGPQRKLLAFPYGAYNSDVIDAGKSVGISLFFGTEEGINTPGQAIINRINAGSGKMDGTALIAKLKEFH